VEFPLSHSSFDNLPRKLILVVRDSDILFIRCVSIPQDANDAQDTNYPRDPNHAQDTGDPVDHPAGTEFVSRALSPFGQ